MTTHFSDVATRFLSRRTLLKGAASAAALSLSPIGMLTSGVARAASSAALAFAELPLIRRDDPDQHVAPGYQSDVLISWGEPILPGAPAFDVLNQSPASQAAQFGYNCDYIGYVPLDGSTRGLLGVNHESQDSGKMFPPGGAEDKAAERAAIERASVGFSVIEVKKDGGKWSVMSGSQYARRITADTPIAISGPLRGHARMKTSADPDGETVFGSCENCSGGTTPWDTFLTCEENIQNNFACKPGALSAENAREALGVESFGVGAKSRWAKYERRFDMGAEPHEFNRFGWVVEIDPRNPGAIPKKRTALGRFRHEAANLTVNGDGRVVVYLADDQKNECVYRFVTARAFDAANLAANADLLDEGTLSVARFHDDGTGEWLPLLHGQNGLTKENGFDDQGDVLIDARRAARQLGATLTDRPEDIETDPVTSRAYIAFTGNPDRKEPIPSMPRVPNLRGHIIEILPPGEDGARDHTALSFQWDIFILAGHAEAEASAQGRYGAGTTPAGYFANPDNLAFDPDGRLWIASDGAEGIGIANGLWACCVTGDQRAVSRHFYAAPRGAEVTGPCFTPDGETLFLSIQHPGDDEGSTFEAPTTRWPAAMDSAMPPRPSVVAITRTGGGKIGT